MIKFQRTSKMPLAKRRIVNLVKEAGGFIGVHKIKEVRERIEAAAAESLYLPASSIYVR